MATDKQIVLITGANNGIGFDTASLLARTSPNFHVVLTARTPSKGEQAVKDIQSLKPQGALSFLQLDVTSDDSIATAAQQIQSEFGRVDVLVNNAGIAAKDPRPTREILRNTFETNVFGPTLLTEALTPLLKASKSPKVINVTSELGSIAQRSDSKHNDYQVVYPVYRMSKAALNMLTACQYFELKEFGAKVWSFCPGFVVTDLTGKDMRQFRIDHGAESSETSAQGILEIIEGKRDAEVGTFIARYGKQVPW